MNKEIANKHESKHERWQGIIADALKLSVGDVETRLLAEGVNNSVYHVRIKGGGASRGGASGDRQDLILRVPEAGKKLMSYGAIGDKQIKDRFATFAQSGFSPQLVDVELAEGGILCEFIAGRQAKFPDDLSLIARSLAALHTSGIAGAAGQVGLATEHNTISYATMQKVIRERLAILDEVQASKLQLSDESYELLKQLQDICEQAPAKQIAEYEQQSLLLPILKDANPSNFIIAGGGGGTANGGDTSGMSGGDEDNLGDTSRGGEEKAVVVDIEGDFYGLPIIDVGHSSLFSACLWAYPDIKPVAPAEIVGLYEEYYEAVAQLHGKELAKQVRAPREIITSIRYGTLGRCLGWMLMLIYLAEVKGVATPEEKIIRARAILSQKNLQLAMTNETAISQLI